MRSNPFKRNFSIGSPVTKIRDVGDRRRHGDAVTDEMWKKHVEDVEEHNASHKASGDMASHEGWQGPQTWGGGGGEGGSVEEEKETPAAKTGSPAK